MLSIARATRDTLVGHWGSTAQRVLPKNTRQLMAQLRAHGVGNFRTRRLRVSRTRPANVFLGTRKPTALRARVSSSAPWGSTLTRPVTVARSALRRLSSPNISPSIPLSACRAVPALFRSQAPRPSTNAFALPAIPDTRSTPPWAVVKAYATSNTRHSLSCGTISKH